MNENEDKPVTITVGDFVARLLERQAEFEREVGARLAETDRRVEEIFALQQEALREAVETLHSVLSSRDQGPIN